MWFFTIVVYASITVLGATETTVNLPMRAVTVKVPGFDTQQACEVIRQHVIFTRKKELYVSACEQVELPPR